MCSSVTEEKGTWDLASLLTFSATLRWLPLLKTSVVRNLHIPYFAFDFICTLEPLNARNHRKCLAFPMETSAHSCLLLIIEVWHVIMQLYKLISLSAAGCSVRKAESHLSFLISGWCDTRCHLGFIKTPWCGGCSQHGEGGGVLCLACEAAVALPDWRIL